MNTEPAFPYSTPQYPGLTKRELFAAMAMQGLCANPSRVGKFDGYAVDALRLTDALLAALAPPSEERKL